MTADLQNPIFTDEDAAREHLESLRWPNGPVCPHCGSAEDSIRRLEGKAHRPGLFQCNACRSQFSVTVGTVFERSKIPLSKWLLATYLLCSSKKGISSHQIHRMLGVTYKTAWFMTHRIREAMKDDGDPLGGPGVTLEADETYFGNKAEQPTETTSGRPFTKGGRAGPAGKRAVVSLVERGGRVRSFNPQRADADTVRQIVSDNTDIRSDFMTDESRLYKETGKAFASHEHVRHSTGEYVRGNAYTNTIEGYFSIFKRGMTGVYQHCAEKHLHRYLAEFDFRYSNRIALGVDDADRTHRALKGVEGKRLTYRRTGGQLAA